jgi:hypothetical protein
MDYSKHCIEIFENSLSPDLCGEIIRRFEEDGRKIDGGVGYGDGTIAADHTLKKCTELYLSSFPEWKDIDEILYKEVTSKMLQLREKVPGLARVNTVNDEGYRIKKYNNDGTEFFNWHIDQNGRAQGHRYLIFQWYLNDVKKGGETEFRLQKIKVNPVAGRLICFPPYWTHEHRGLAPVSGPKYILCSWITF